ncbi:MAG TPA: HAD hydrolase-like protein [Candidatus Saccharimonadales bacterium]|nr:HAD hydrolase-like protein [Candidatus Saccharimonadales bacterium]
MKTSTIIELADTVQNVDFSAWQKAGIRVVGLDVDGTITTHNGSEIEPGVIEHIRAAAKKGMRFVLFTNNMFTRRLQRMQAAFGPNVIEGIYNPRYLLDRKPRRILLRRMQNELGLKLEHIGVVGNTYTADVRAAVRMGVARVAWVEGYARHGVLDTLIRRPLKRYHRRRLK